MSLYSERLGKYIVIEGTDATGKSTVADLIANKVRSEGKNVIRVDEPDSAKDADGTALVPIATELRRIIKDKTFERSEDTNILLFTAQRLENWRIMEQALKLGSWVISARNWLSTVAFQGYGEGADKDLIESMTSDFVGRDYMQPTKSFILDVDEEERLRRLNGRGEPEKPDTFESLGNDFQARVRLGYKAIAEYYEIPIISALPPAQEVADTIWQNINEN